MSYVPLPVRVAVGLMVTAVEQVRKLPEQLIDLPVTAASRVVQTGMRVQQRVTELAIKGDQVFALLQPVEDTPPWARFDEDGEPTPPRTNPAVSGSGPGTKTAETTPAAPKTSGGGAGLDKVEPAPALLVEYEEMSLAQLRGRLRGFSLDQLVGLLQHEQAHRDRPPFVTMLSNRISSVRAQQSRTS